MSVRLDEGRPELSKSQIIIWKLLKREIHSEGSVVFTASSRKGIKKKFRNSQNWCHKVKTKQNGFWCSQISAFDWSAKITARTHHKQLKTPVAQNTAFSYSDAHHTNSQYLTWAIPSGVKLQYIPSPLRGAILETFGSIPLYIVSLKIMCQSAPSKQQPRTRGLY